MSNVNTMFRQMLLGIFLTGLLLAAAFWGLRLGTWHLWNLFFLFSIGMGVFALLAPKLDSLYPQYFFCGLTCLGWPQCTG